MTADLSGKVYAVGEFTSKLAASYLNHLASVPSEQPVELRERLKTALGAVDLHVTGHQVFNIIKALQEYRAERQVSGGVAGGVAWGEFCAIAVEIYSLNKRNNITESPPTKAAPQRVKRWVDVSSHHDVFLGGSCNPTTWRCDTAIPYLQQCGLTYYNPQVEHWYPELIEIEEQAKMAASVLLFVVDKETRALSSMVEVGYLTGQGRDLVAVVEDLDGGPGKGSATIRGDVLSDREVEDLNRGRLFVRNILEEGRTALLTDNITHALQVSQKVVGGNNSVEQYRHSTSCHRLRPTLGEEIHLLARVFHMYDNSKKNRLSLNELDLVMKSLHIDGPLLQQLLRGKVSGGGNSPDIDGSLLAQYSEHGLTFHEFCCVYAELKHGLLEVSSWATVTHTLTAPFRWISNWLWPRPPTVTPAHAYVDVFLNGSCGSTTWRNDISIPVLKRYGVSYFNPQVANWDRRLLPIEQEAKERCCVILYVITGDTLGVASLVEAAYYIGKGRSIVLCVEDIHSTETGATVEGMKLSPAAVKDYNRGRAYMVAMANKSRVPVYSDIAAATMATVDLALCVRGVQTRHRPRDSSV